MSNWKEAICQNCGLKQNVDLDEDYDKWKCIFCFHIHYLKKGDEDREKWKELKKGDKLVPIQLIDDLVNKFKKGDGE